MLYVDRAIGQFWKLTASIIVIIIIFIINVTYMAVL